MHAFHGDLLIGGLALRNLDGQIEGDQTDSEEIKSDEPPASWQGEFTVDRCQTDVLEVGRQYLLMLDDGRNREVMLTEIDEEADDAPVCRFEACVRRLQPK